MITSPITRSIIICITILLCNAHINAMRTKQKQHSKKKQKKKLTRNLDSKKRNKDKKITKKPKRDYKRKKETSLPKVDPELEAARRLGGSSLFEVESARKHGTKPKINCVFGSISQASHNPKILEKKELVLFLSKYLELAITKNIKREKTIRKELKSGNEKNYGELSSIPLKKRKIEYYQKLLKKIIKPEYDPDAKFYKYSKFIKERYKTDRIHTKFPLKRAYAVTSKHKNEKFGIISCIFNTNPPVVTEGDLLSLSNIQQLERDNYGDIFHGYLKEQAKTIQAFKENIKKQKGEIKYWFIITNKSPDIRYALGAIFDPLKWSSEGDIPDTYILHTQNIFYSMTPQTIFNKLYKNVFKKLYKKVCLKQNIPLISSLLQETPTIQQNVPELQNKIRITI